LQVIRVFSRIKNRILCSKFTILYGNQVVINPAYRSSMYLIYTI